jgi:hypothetical protein
MLLPYVAYVLAGLIGLGIIVIGARFLLAPRTAAAAYGVAVERASGQADAYLAVKGVRDIASGLFVFILMAARATHLLAWLMLAATIIPIMDASIVLTHHGSRATAYGVHGATAAVMLATAGLLFISPA